MTAVLMVTVVGTVAVAALMVLVTGTVIVALAIDLAALAMWLRSS